MKKLRIVEQNFLTLEEGCNKYLDNCRSRNLREGTINHYRQSYVQFAKFFDMNMQVSDLDEKMYQKYVVFLRETLHNDVSINSYLRDFMQGLKTPAYFLCFYSPSNCFFLASNSSWVITPLSRSSLYF